MARFARWITRTICAAIALGSVLVSAPPVSEPQTQDGALVDVRQDFFSDPGWEAVGNRVECASCPLVKQDFGWRDGARGGEIGGRIWQSKTPAYYAMPFGRPWTFDDPISASGRIRFGSTVGEGAAYVSFFNSQKQGWRPWSAMGLRFRAENFKWKTAARRGERAPAGKGHVVAMLDYMNGNWEAGGSELDVELSVAVPHTFRFNYDPDAVPAPLTDSNLVTALSRRRQTTGQVFERLRKIEPAVTFEETRKRLHAAAARNQIRHLPREVGNLWSTAVDQGPRKGAMTVQFDDGPVYTLYLDAGHRKAPVAMNRFGIFNVQFYHRWIEFFVSDLVVNGRAIDLSNDPHWEGAGNHAQFVERDFQRQNFGYSQTNWAGEQPGEIGGDFYRTEARDPGHGYYADDVGLLTLDDPISFSGVLNFVAGSTDSGMFIGFFDRAERVRPLQGKMDGVDPPNTLGIEIEGPTHVGYHFKAKCVPVQGSPAVALGPQIRPSGDRHNFRFRYDPKRNGGNGSITAQLDDFEFTLNLTAEQRRAGGHFDRFGIMNIRKGGKFVTLYFDDLQYTARRAPGDRATKRKQKILTLPYPRGGRMY